MKLCYTPINFQAETLKVIDAANSIIEQYQAKGYRLTLRQLYYQFVSKAWLENSDASYDRLGNIISDARLAGLVDWDAIEDRGRFLRGQNYQKDALDAATKTRDEFLIDKWDTQEWRPEIWVEKDALVGVIQPIADELCVNYFGCRGYNSQSEQWRAGQRFASYYQRGQRPIVFHLGDHDPDGLDMTRDNRERLKLFAGVDVPVMRLALNKDQIDKYKPPPNVAKISSSRFQGYFNETGLTSSWELDALPPDVIHDLIRNAVMKIRDPKRWDEALEREAGEKQALSDTLEQLGGSTGE